MVDAMSEVEVSEEARSISGEKLPADWPQIMSKEEEGKVYDILYDEEEDRDRPPSHAQIDRLSYELTNGDKRLRYFAVLHQRDMSGLADPNMVQYDVLENKFKESPPQLVLYEGFMDDINQPLTRERAIQLGEPAFMLYLVQQHNSQLKEGETPVVIESADKLVNNMPDEVRDPQVVRDLADKFGVLDKIDVVMGSGHAIRERAALEQLFKAEESISTSSEVLNDIVITPEQRASMEAFQTKKAKNILTLDKIFPQVENQAAREYAKDDIAAFLTSRVDIAEEDEEDFSKEIYETVMVLNPDNFNDYFKGIASAADNLTNARLFHDFAQRWKEDFLKGSSDESPNDKTRANRTREFMNLMTSITRTNFRPKPEMKSPEEIKALFGSFVDLFNAAYKLPSDEESQKLFRDFTGKAIVNGVELDDAEQVRKAIEVFKLASIEPDKELLNRYINSVLIYGRRHSLTDDAVKGFNEKLFPAMKRHDEDVRVFERGGNIWGMDKGDFGAGDFIARAYALRVSPANLNELIMVAHEIPTSNLTKIEQNRRDGLSLSAPFGALRDFIHDERPYVHDVINAMIKYYDDHDRGQLLVILNKADPGYLGSEERQQRILDLEQYDREIAEVGDWGENLPPKTAKVIDILKRLDKNTEPVAEEPPETNDQHLNELLVKLASEKSQGRIIKEDLGQTLKYMNDELLKMMKNEEVGIEPSKILVLGWLERRAFDVVHSLTYEGQMAAYRQEWFQQVLKFQELTSSPKDFEEEDFNKFLGEVHASDFQTAYRLIFQREIDHIGQLTGKYRDEGHSNWAGALWSMNVAHELIGLTDLRPADTTYGKKHRAELQTPAYARRTGD